VLRFRSRVKPAKVKSGRNRWRLWMLVISLGLVLAAMRHLGKPSTAQRLEQLFTSPQFAVVPTNPKQAASNVEVIVLGSESAEGQTDRSESQPPSLPEVAEIVEDELAEGLAQVKDNTYFRPAEQQAWFGLFEKLQQTDESELRQESCGELSYAQLLQQPEVYRGRIVTIVGTVLREEIVKPAENQLGIESYHRLTLQPEGGGQWPMVVYSLKLPPEFPRGEQLRASVSVTGYFFKNWSYPHQDGLGLAPVVLTNELQWQPPVAVAQAEPVSPREWTVGIFVACCFAAISTWIAIRYTRRSPYRSVAPQNLQELASWESES